MKIKKLQTGGVAPFMTYTPNVATPQEPVTQQQETKKEPKEAGILSKEVIKLITENGIPSDVSSFMKQINKFTNSIQDLSSQDSAQLYSMIIPKLAEIKYNKEQLIKTRDNLYSNGGLNEAAITTNGGVVTRSEDGTTNIVSIDEYAKDPSKYTIVTNNELEKMRAYDPSLAFNSNTISILQNGQGTENVTKELQGVISQMKVQKEKRQGFIPSEQIKALKGLDIIEGISKVTNENESSRVYKDFASEYLYNMLSQKSRNLLRLKAAQRGIKPKDMIELLIMPSTMESNSETIDLNSEKTKSESKKGGSESSSRAEWQFLQQWVADKVGPIKNYKFNLGSQYEFSVPASKITGFIDAGTQKMLPTNSSVLDITEKSLSTIGDSGNVWLGNKKIGFEQQSRVISTGKNNSKVYMPLDLEALSRNEYKPDLEVAESLKTVADRIKNEGAENNEGLKKLIYKEEGVEEYYGDVMSNPYFAPFAAVNVILQGEGLVDGSNKHLFKKVKPENKDRIKELINSGIQRRERKDGDKDYTYGGFKGWFGIDDDEFYEGLVFIHTLNDTKAAAMAGNYLTMPKSYNDMDTVERREYERQIDKSKNNAVVSTSVLNE